MSLVLKKILVFFLVSFFISCKSDSKGKNVSITSNSSSQLVDSLTNDLQKIYKNGGFVGFSVAIVNQDSTHCTLKDLDIQIKQLRKNIQVLQYRI